MALINNWDTADTTNKEIHLVTPPGQPQEQWYTIPGSRRLVRPVRGPARHADQMVLAGVSALRPEQVKIAFEAAGATAAEADAFAMRLIEKIQELMAAVGSTR
jgi:hypothetical protein